MSRDVEAKVTIDAPPSAVWKALTDADELMNWFPLQARATPGEGGEIWMSWGGHYEGASTIQVWEPGRHLSLGFFPADGPGPIVTDYYLQADGGKTILRVVSSGFGTGEEWDEFYEGVGHGWAFELRGLQHYLERHPGEFRVVAWAKTQYLNGREKAWRMIDDFLGGISAKTGQPYALKTATGDELRGIAALFRPPRQFAGTAENWNDGMFRAELEGGKTQGNVWLWLATYGVPKEKVRALEERWQGALDKAFGAA